MNEERPRLQKPSRYYPIRRSTRLPLEIPVRVTSQDPKIQFSEQCTTATVNAHGCGVIAPKCLPSGARVQIEIVSDAQKASARVLDVVPLNDEQTSWLLGMEMEKSGNFWGIKYAPADWLEEEQIPAAVATTHAAGEVPPATFAAAATDSASQKRPGIPVKETVPLKEVPAAVLRKLLSECRLAAISTGGCYVQTGTTFPPQAPVQVTIQAGGKGHQFTGTVRVEHVGSGMGIEFSTSGAEHSQRISEAIDALGQSEGKIPEVSVALAAPVKAGPGKSAGSSQMAGKSAHYDALLALILVGAALKRSDFLRELEKQRRHN